MVQKIYNLAKWFELKDGEKLTLQHGVARRVRLEVNAPSETLLYASSGGGMLMFVARVLGRDLVEFHTMNDEQLDLFVSTEGGSVFIYTVDGQDVSHVSEDAESFTKIMERKPRNHELERMQYEMQANMRRMMESQADELQRIVDRRLAAERAVVEAAGSASGAGKEPAPAVKGGTSDKQPPASVEGDKGGAGEGKPEPK